MKWRVWRMATADDYPAGTGRWWVSQPYGTVLGRRYHHTHREALDRAFKKAYGR